MEEMIEDLQGCADILLDEPNTIDVETFFEYKGQFFRVTVDRQPPAFPF